ncbi:NUDIX hydrolase [Barrientosiimonas marina]|uniref:NUDIX hydrolase n=1 Tax=Lentibacillus kimchii TaxID=1542911 RepID=A0ABW2V011_9BACI
MKKFMETTTQSETIYDGRIVKVQVDDVMLPDGKTSKRELIKHAGAVGIIPVTKANKIVFVEQFRKPLEKSLVEIPAGKLEKGEEPSVTALRELEEETGYTVNTPRFITSFYTSPGFADEMMYLYLAEDLEPVDYPAAGDEDEFIEILELTLDEAKQYVREQRIHDAKTNYAILYLETLERM